MLNKAGFSELVNYTKKIIKLFLILNKKGRDSNPCLFLINNILSVYHHLYVS